MEKITEIVTNRVFFQVRSDKPSAGIHMDESDGYIYHYHCMDTLYKAVKIRKYFGPMTLSTIQRHCAIVDASLKHTAGRHLYYTNNAETIGYQQKRTNAIFLVGCYLILRKNCSPDETREKLQEVMVSVTPYTDMEGSTAHTLTLLDCWRGLYHGMVVQQWFQKRDAKVDVTLNDGSDDVANWVVPDRLLALEDPKEPRYMGRGAPIRSSVVDYFKQKHVETVVRLNSKDYEFRTSYGQPYDSEEFVCRAIKHYDIFFKDGGIPSETQLQGFCKIVKTARRPIAVHCHAGRGRTGTMLACSLIRFWGFDATQAIAWIRMCRAACIVGIQQGFVKLVDSRIKEMSEMTAVRKNKEKVEIAAVQRMSLAYPQADKVCKLRKEAAESEEKRRARREKEVSSAHLRLRHRTAIKRRSHTKSSKAHEKGVTREKRLDDNSVEKVTVLPISDALNDVRRRRQRTISSTKTPETQRRVSLESHLSKITQGKCESKKDIDKTKLKNQQERLSSRESKTAPLDLKILRKMHPLYEQEQTTKYLRAEVSEKFGCYVVKSSGVNGSPSPPAKRNAVETTKGKRLEGLRGQIRAQRSVPYELKERVADAQDEILRAQPTRSQIKPSKSSVSFVKPQTKYSSYQPTFEQLTKLLNFEKESKNPVSSCPKEYKTLANSKARESQKTESNSWQGHRSAQNRSKNCKNVVGGRIKAERRLAWQEPEANPQCSTKTDVPVLCMTTRNSRRAVHSDFNFVEKQRAALLALNPVQCNVVCNGGKTRSII